MEENQTMTNEQLESKLKSLRVKATLTKILTYCAAAAMILMWFFMENLAMGLVSLVIAVVFAYLSSKSKRKSYFELKSNYRIDRRKQGYWYLSASAFCRSNGIAQK